MMGLSPLELVVIMAVIVLLFGTRKLPELGSGLGQAIGNFRKSMHETNLINVTPQGQAAPEKTAEKKEPAGTSQA